MNFVVTLTVMKLFKTRSTTER